MEAKSSYIKHLQQARAEHVKWVNNIKLLLSGVDIDEKEIVLNPAESKFGQWYYNKAMLFVNSNAWMILEDIEKLFLSIHESYMKIYPIYFTKKSKGFFSKGTKSVSSHEKVLAQTYYEELVGISDNLKNKLNLFEKQLYATPIEKFQEIMQFDSVEIRPNDILDNLQKNEDADAYHYGARGRR